MAAIKPLSAVLFAVLALFLYNRARPLYALYNNAPSRLNRINTFKNPGIKFPATLRNCEDVLLEEKEGFALLSCDPSRDTWNTVMVSCLSFPTTLRLRRTNSPQGTFISPTSSPDTGIYLWNYANPSSTPKKIALLDFNQGTTTFHPLGIEYHPRSKTLFIINHAPSGSVIEVFKFHPSEDAATHINTLSHPGITTPNSILALGETELLVTNDHFFRRRFYPRLAVLETYLAFRGGNVVHLDLNNPLTLGIAELNVLTNVPFANGIAQLNDSTIAVASSSMNAVFLYALTRPEKTPRVPKLVQIRSIALAFHPDNLSVDGNENLLIAGHPHGPTLEKVSKGSALCNSGTTAGEEACEKGLSWVAEWSESGGLKTLFAGDEYGTSATAVRDVGRKIGIVSGLYAKGLYMWEI